MKRPHLTALHAWLGLLVALIASAAFTAPAQAASGSLAGTGAKAPAAGAGGGPVTELIAGAAHTCATFSDKTLQCWGNNEYGQLGDGTTVNASKPVNVKGFPVGPAITLTRAVHNCSVMDNGTVQCWGMNKYGQLGDGTITNSANPIPVKGLREGVRLMTIGGDHSCVTYKDDDTTWCWGQNKYGELGDGKFNPGSLVPVEVKGLPSPPVKFAAGLWHTCGVLQDGATWCWGHNEEGELGNGAKGFGSSKPVQVKGLPSTPVELTAGLFHTCALVKDGSTWCWGEGKYGQLGNGTTQTLPTPKPVVGLSRNPTHLVAGGFHTCATFADGTMWCWGQNNFGQLGNGSTTDSAKPVKVEGLRPDPALVAGGSLHTCVAYADATVNCWGLNAAGQLGNGTFTNATTPVAVIALAKPAAAPGKQPSSDEDGTSVGKVAGIGLPIVAVVAVVGFVLSRRSRRT